MTSRGGFRTAVAFSALTAAIVAGATASFFHVGPDEVVWEVVGTSMAWAFGISAIASLVGLAALQFFESAFDITTSLSLLDLTDRNHEALQLLQEKAFGTFNHSLMVGTLAHAAARAIGANALLARAMAYYHDLGKTENPTMFIENQFGIPESSRLPDAAGVGRGHPQARERRDRPRPSVQDPLRRRHGNRQPPWRRDHAVSSTRRPGLKKATTSTPTTSAHRAQAPDGETAIVMLSDSLEAACRANFQTEEPTPRPSRRWWTGSSTRN